MTAPFIVFSLPRSRSAWLSHFLRKEVKVGHDIGIECNSPGDFFRALGPGMLAGTCETGASFAWPLVRLELPTARVVVIRRSASDVTASLEKQGVMGQGDEMLTREAQLKTISASPGVTTITFADLEKPAVLEWVYEHLTGLKLDPSWLGQMAAVNIQLKMGERLRRLDERREAISGLKAQVRKRLEWLN